MALAPCPSCGLQRAPEDLDRSACPVCGHRPGDPVREPVDAPAAPVAEAPVRPTPAPGTGNGQNVALIIVFAGMAAVALLLMLLTTTAVEPPPPPQVVPIAAPPVAAEPPPEPVTVVAPAPPETNHSGIEVAPRPRPVVFAPVVLRVDRPDDEYTVERVGEGNTLRLVGRVRKLIVGGADAGAVFDASGLEAKDVSITGPVAGGATLRVKALDGNVYIRDGIDGRAVVAIDAGAGTVTFPSTGGKGRKAGIGGGAVVTVTGKSVQFGGAIDGDGTRVTVTVANGGGVKFATLDGSAELLYRPAHPADPPPRMSAGEVRGQASCRRVE